jgi:hypothetical protein
MSRDGFGIFLPPATEEPPLYGDFQGEDGRVMARIG